VDALVLNASGKDLAQKLKAKLGKQARKVRIQATIKEDGTVGALLSGFTWVPKGLPDSGEIRIYLPELRFARLAARLDGKAVWSVTKSASDALNDRVLRILSPPIRLAESKHKPAKDRLTIQVNERPGMIAGFEARGVHFLGDLYSDFAHPNHRGHRMMAALLQELLTSEGLKIWTDVAPLPGIIDAKPKPLGPPATWRTAAKAAPGQAK